MLTFCPFPSGDPPRYERYKHTPNPFFESNHLTVPFKTALPSVLSARSAVNRAGAIIIVDDDGRTAANLDEAVRKAVEAAFRNMEIGVCTTSFSVVSRFGGTRLFGTANLLWHVVKDSDILEAKVVLVVVLLFSSSLACCVVVGFVWPG